MDTWHRCIAAGGDERVIRPSIILGGFSVAAGFAIPILMGLPIFGAVDPRTQDLALVLSFSKIPREAWLSLAQTIAYGGFLGALFSTASTLLLNAAYSMVYDLQIAPDVTTGPARFTRSESAVQTLRAWVLLLGTISIVIFLLFLVLPIYAIIFALFSSQAILGILVLYHFVVGDASKRREPGAFWTILFCFVASFVLVVAGISIGNTDLVNGAPVIAVGLGAILFFAIPRAKAS